MGGFGAGIRVRLLVMDSLPKYLHIAANLMDTSFSSSWCLPTWPTEFRVAKTAKFAVVTYRGAISDKLTQHRVWVHVDSEYTSDIVHSTINRRQHCFAVSSFDAGCTYQIAEFESIEWEPVLAGKCSASSYLVRKGLSRKAQLAVQLKKYMVKHLSSILHQAVPVTLVIETWDAFEEMKFNFGQGAVANFTSGTTMQAPLRQRLEWCLEDIRETLQKEQYTNWTWILKSSVTNKGGNIAIVHNWEEILDVLEDAVTEREWVLQRYIDRPLTVIGHKFHLRVYVLCVGALKVYVFGRILMLLAAHNERMDMFAHLTNTAYGAKDVNFDEKKYVKLLDDLPDILLDEGKVESMSAALNVVKNIRSQINTITGELFAAFENEYTVFCPMNNCFEIYGLDFMVDADYGVHVLEVNPGPDFKQTGGRLRSVIVELWEQTCQIVLDGRNDLQDYSLVYDKEWSVSQMKGGGMALV